MFFIWCRFRKLSQIENVLNQTGNKSLSHDERNYRNQPTSRQQAEQGSQRQERSQKEAQDSRGRLDGRGERGRHYRLPPV